VKEIKTRLIAGVNDLSSQFPELALEWDYQLNGDLKPENVTISSSKELYWTHQGEFRKKEFTYTWQSTVSDRVRGRECPIYSGKAVLPDINSFMAIHPILAASWDYSKNTITPDKISHASGDKYFWIHIIDKNGVLFIHRWEQSADKRAQGKGCPICSGREVMINFNDFASQYPGCAKEWYRKGNGKTRPDQYTSQSNKMVLWRCEGKYKEKNFIYIWRASIAARAKGGNCPIYSGKKILPQFSFATMQPEEAREWDCEKNGEKIPEDYSVSSNKKFYFTHTVRKNDELYIHNWDQTLNKRSLERGCPICSNREVQIGYNDFPSQFPELFIEWDMDLNKGLNPYLLFGGSDKKVWWSHDVLVDGEKQNHSWEANIRNRTGGKKSGCRKCYNLKKRGRIVTNTL
jgi:hypothetical protein